MWLHSFIFALSVISVISQAQTATPSALELLEQQRTQELSEARVLEYFRKGSVGQKEEQALNAKSQLDASLTRENYQARLYSGLNLQSSIERSPNPYQPVLSPYQDWNAGVEQNLPIGTKLGVEAFGTKYSFRGGQVVNATQVGVRTKAQLDLWKNFFGSLDRAQLKSAEARKARAEFQLKTGLKRQEVEIRKAYWSFVAAERSILLSNELIATAERQLADVRQRQREGVADRGEVARYQSQLESRRSSKLLFMYQRESLMQNLERQFQDFRSTLWKLPTSMERTEKLVQQCIVDIGQQKDIDLNATYYDEMIYALKAETEAELKVARKHNDIDLALVAQYQTTGTDDSYNGAREDLQDHSRGGYTVGLQFSVPLGSTKTNSEKYLLQTKRDSLEAESMQLTNNLRSTHETMLKSIAYLTEGLKNQIENSRNLNTSYQQMLIKYRQGRIPVSSLIIEQDSLFQSELTEIDLRRQISHVVLDYFTVFTNFNCSWNKI